MSFEKWLREQDEGLLLVEPELRAAYNAAAEACAKACENIESGRMTATKTCAAACRALKAEQEGATDAPER